MKTCTKCNQTKPLTEFYKHNKTKDGFNNQCKECYKEYYQTNKECYKEYYQTNKECKKKYQKEYDQNNKERKSERNKKYKQNNKERIAEYNKEYRQNNKERLTEYSKEHYQNNKERIAEYQKEYDQNNKKRKSERAKEYYQNNKERLTEYTNNRLKTDELFKAKHCIRNLIRNSINRMGYSKNSKTFHILGCTYEEFKSHIEQKFAPGMSWDNKHLWHLDHKDPISLATTEEEVIALNHYKNFQPLWAEDNLAKSNNINWEKDPNKYNTP